MQPRRRAASRTALRSAVILILAVCGAAAHATWSIVAVDPAIGAVGLAAATCGVGIEHVAGIVPGRGAVAAQAETSFTGRDRARAMMTDGATATAVIEALADPELYQGWFRSQLPNLQYGVATLHDGVADAAALSGDALQDWYGSATDAEYSVQGNMLRGPEVVRAAARAFESARDSGLPLAERLLLALEAGRDAGGDRRCPSARPSRSAVLIVALPGDPPETPSVEIVTPHRTSLLTGLRIWVFGQPEAEDAVDPVALLRERYGHHSAAPWR